MPQDYSVPRVGIDILILKDGKVLAGKRKGAHGEGEYSFPGGSLEMMESYADCARRETLEECGVHIKNVRFNFTANSFHFDPRHYICIGLVADWESGEPTVLEPDKCESWDWYDLDALPDPMFIYCKLAVEAYRAGIKCFDSDGIIL